jgi:hypothetical protein
MQMSKSHDNQKKIVALKTGSDNANVGSGPADPKASLAVSPPHDKQSKSVELAKAGFENAQGRIGAIDTKVSIAVGLLVAMLPVPIVVAGWLSGLSGTAATHIFGTCRGHPLICLVLAAFLMIGMAFAFLAIMSGASCLSPRGPKGYCTLDPWRPNVLFPLHHPNRKGDFCTHVGQLKEGVDLPFVIDEYEHQLLQIGNILHEKITDMKHCFKQLSYCLVCYGCAVFLAMFLALTAFLKVAMAIGP